MGTKRGKLSASRLKQIIQEELKAVLSEAGGCELSPGAAKTHAKLVADYGEAAGDEYKSAYCAEIAKGHPDPKARIIARNTVQQNPPTQ
jgi:hypothetical protein